MPLLEKVCCCLSLVQGARVFGYFGILASVYNFSKTIIKLHVSDEEADFLKWNLIFMQILLIIAAMCLVCATITGNRKLVLPWLIVFWPALVFLNIIVLFFSYEVIGEMSLYQEYRAKLFILGNLDGFGIYIWLCIFSYYQSLQCYQYAGDHENMMEI